MSAKTAVFANLKPNFDKPTKAKTEKPGVPLSGLREYAMVCSLLKTLEGIQITMEADVKGKAREIFLANAKGQRPENFRGTDKNADASVELRKRSVRSAFSKDEADLLESKGIPFTVEETIVINPNADPALVARAEKALAKVEGVENLFLKQSKRVCSEETVASVFQKGLGGELLDIVTTLSLKPKVQANPAELVEFITAIVNPEYGRKETMASFKASAEKVGTKK